MAELGPGCVASSRHHQFQKYISETLTQSRSRGFRNRIVVYLNWCWAWFTYGRGARLITGVAPRNKAAAQWTLIVNKGR